MHGTERADNEQVSLARFATQLARALGEAGHTPAALEVQAEVWPAGSEVGGERGALQLKVRCDAPRLDQATLAGIASRTAQEWPSWKQFSQTVDADLMRPPPAPAPVAVPTTPEIVAVRADGAASAPALEGAGEEKPRRFRISRVVSIGLALLLLVGGAAAVVLALSQPSPTPLAAPTTVAVKPTVAAIVLKITRPP